jgi:hypothetical protein
MLDEGRQSSSSSTHMRWRRQLSGKAIVNSSFLFELPTLLLPEFVAWLQKNKAM